MNKLQNTFSLQNLLDFLSHYSTGFKVMLKVTILTIVSIYYTVILVLDKCLITKDDLLDLLLQLRKKIFTCKHSSDLITSECCCCVCTASAQTSYLPFPFINVIYVHINFSPRAINVLMSNPFYMIQTSIMYELLFGIELCMQFILLN